MAEVVVELKALAEIATIGSPIGSAGSAAKDYAKPLQLLSTNPNVTDKSPSSAVSDATTVDSGHDTVHSIRAANVNIDVLCPKTNSFARLGLPVPQTITLAPMIKPTLQQRLFKASTMLIVVLGTYAVLYLTFGSSATPGSTMFNLFIGFVLAQVLGAVVAFIGIAPLVGMILAGVLLRNSGAVRAIPGKVSSTIRTMCVSLIFASCGKGLSVAALRKESRGIAFMGLMPGICEFGVASLVGTYLFDMPMLWSMAMASGLASTSPAVIVPLVQDLRDSGYINRDGTASLILGSLPLDVLMSVVGNSVFLGVIFTPPEQALMVYLHAPIELFGGIVGGGLMAGIAWLMKFSNLQADTKIAFPMVISFTVAIGLFGKYIAFNGAASLTIILFWFAISNLWDVEHKHSIGHALQTLWEIVRGFFFIVIGMAFDFKTIPFAIAMDCLVLLACCVSVRFVAGVYAVKLSGRGNATSAFASGMWCGKASIQAALSSVALDMTVAAGSDPQAMLYANYIFRLYVIAILICAPGCAIWVRITARSLLVPDAAYKGEK